MNQTELIEKIAGMNDIPESDQKQYFELLLIRLSELLKERDEFPIGDLGRFELRKSFKDNENDFLIFITNEGKELFFTIPETEENVIAEPVDSFFSISIGKPVIPFKGKNDEELFIPKSADEKKRFLELKVEKFIDNSPVEIERTNNLDDIKFSFLNWKKTTDVNDEINELEKKISESTIPPEEPFEEKAETELIQEEDIDNSLDESEEEILSEEDQFILNDKEAEEELIEDDLTIEEPELVDEISEPDENLEEIVDEISYEERLPEILDEDKTTKAKADEKLNEDPVIRDAFKYAEEKRARLNQYKKRSKSGFIFAGIFIIVIAAAIYLFSVFTDNNQKVLQSTTTEIKSTPEENLSTGSETSQPENILPSGNEPETNNITGSTTPPEPEIRDAKPSKRIKGYIYQYEDGTYAAQVSSWKTRSIALSETKKYLDAGYKAFIEQTDLSGKTYYRVRIGGFASLEEADEFLKK